MRFEVEARGQVNTFCERMAYVVRVVCATGSSATDAPWSQSSTESPNAMILLDGVVCECAVGLLQYAQGSVRPSKPGQCEKSSRMPGASLDRATTHSSTPERLRARRERQWAARAIGVGRRTRLSAFSRG
eukprot:scaffold80481_cov32-Tisochrysis_lutea.AAC.2